jgi:hypothetical protein
MELGKKASAQGSCWWGYQVPVSAPHDHPVVLPIFVELFRFIKSAFPAAQTDVEQDRFFVELFERCDKAQDQLDCIDEIGDVIISIDAYKCLLQLRQDLLVWCPGRLEPRRSPKAGRNLPTFL